MAPYPDRPDLLIAGAWHFAPPTAPFLPFPTAFCSAEWDPDGMDPPPLGEQPPRGAYSKGPLQPAFQGQHFCGSPDVWLNGQASTAPPLPVDANGIPLCCQAAAFAASITGSACGCGTCFVA